MRRDTVRIMKGDRRTQIQILALSRQVLVRLVVWAGAVIMLAPFFWLISSSLKDLSKLWLFPPQWIPNPIRWDNYSKALTTMPFLLFFKNTIIIIFFVEVGTLVTSSLCAYGFTFCRFPGRNFIFFVVLSTMMLPYAVIIIPTYIMWKYLHGIDTFYPLIVPFFFGGGAFNIFLLRQFFRTLPPGLIDAARIDGCSELGIYARIVIPLSKPALATIGVFAFMWHWNDFLAPLVYLSTPEKFTVSLGLASFLGLYSTQWGYLMAAATVVTIPVVLVFFFAQRYFVEGITLTGMKG